MKTQVQKVLQNVVDELESETRIFEQMDNEFKDNMFYKDYANVS